MKRIRFGAFCLPPSSASPSVRKKSARRQTYKHWSLPLLRVELQVDSAGNQMFPDLVDLERCERDARRTGGRVDASGSAAQSDTLK
jgi:hypothetical protein